MLRFWFLFLFLSGFKISQAQEKNYDADRIPFLLKKNASVVVREEIMQFEVRSKDKAVLRSHRVVTVLGESGKEALSFYQFTDKFHSLGDVSMELFDASGKSIRKYSKNNLVSQSAGEGLVYDGKVHYISFPVSEYPVTLFVDYELKYSGLLNYPDYHYQLPGQSVEHSEYTISYPPDLDVNYKAKNTNLQPEKRNDGKTKTLTWSVNNLTAIEDEEGAVARESRYPTILIAPSRFSLDGYDGDLSSWKSFGAWYMTLLKDMVNLSEDRKEFFRTLVKDASTDREKAAIIYRYLQQNCRYVLITLGIGGFKPFEASFVDKKKYGDCKALSNYTRACLDAVGIKSYLALVNADYNREPVDPAFPHNSFNHVILCVPQPADSIWLECTSTSNDFGVLGSFTENRNALLITEDGGKLVPTPVSRSSENQVQTSTRIELKDDGSGTAIMSLNTSGEYKQDILHYIQDEKKDDQKKFLVNRMGLIQPDELLVRVNKADEKRAVTIEMNFEKIPDFSAGSKMFLHPRIHRIWSSALPKSEKRTQDFFFQNPFIKTDTTIYHLPDGYGVENLPKPKALVFKYGGYNSSASFDPVKKEVTIIARLELTRNRIPIAEYSDAKKFFDQVLDDYNEKLVVKRL